jgi:hypothetical protein
MGQYRNLIGGPVMSGVMNVGFWSYAHRDNDLDRGRVGRLAQDLANEFELLSGQALGIFVDRWSIEWGNEWRRRIDQALGGTMFFIAIVTPLYLLSTECRREFLEFTENLDSGGSKVLLPILYADTPAVSNPNDGDEVARMVRQTQYEDWRTLRLTAEDSPEYRRNIHRMASRILRILS